MSITERTDPAAAHRAEHHVQDLMEDAISRGVDGPSLHVEQAAVKVVDSFTAHFERRDGLRRVVLTGEWEVDPAVVVARQVAAAVPA
jgi:hypothetical protein